MAWKKKTKSHRKILLGSVVTVALILFLALALIAVKSVSKSPALSVQDSWDQSFSLSQGYIADVAGKVSNSGNENANNVRVVCIAKRNGVAVGQEIELMGTVLAGTSKSFAMKVDYEGRERVFGDCEATCSNC